MMEYALGLEIALLLLTVVLFVCSFLLRNSLQGKIKDKERADRIGHMMQLGAGFAGLLVSGALFMRFKRNRNMYGSGAMMMEDEMY